MTSAKIQQPCITGKSIIDSARIHTELEKVDNSNSAINRAGKWITDLKIETEKQDKRKFVSLPVKEGFQQKLKCGKKEICRTERGHIIYKEYLTQFINSKMIGKKYLEGISTETIQLAFNFNNEINFNAKIKFEDYLYSEVSDIDLTRDIKTNFETFKIATLRISNLLNQNFIEHTRYKETGNIEIGKREGGKPHITIYWKDAEITSTHKKQWRQYNRTLNENEIHSYYEELKDSATNIARIEINMTMGTGRDADKKAWELSGFEKPQTLKELIERNDSGEFNEIPLNAIDQFYMNNKRKSSKETGLLKPTDYALVKMIKMLIDARYKIEDIEQIAEDYQYKAGAKQYNASKLRAKIKAMIEESKLWPTDEDLKKELLIEAEKNPILKAIGFKKWIE